MSDIVIGKFTASGATFEQVKAVFAADGFHVLTFVEIDARPAGLAGERR